MLNEKCICVNIVWMKAKIKEDILSNFVCLVYHQKQQQQQQAAAYGGGPYGYAAYPGPYYGSQYGPY